MPNTPHTPAYPAGYLDGLLLNHPDLRITTRPAPQMVVVPLMIPLFDHAENLRVAQQVGFDPAVPGRARETYQDSTFWSFPGKVTRLQKERAWFYLALGLYILVRLEEDGIIPPPDLEDWRARWTERLCEERFFVPSSGRGAADA